MARKKKLVCVAFPKWEGDYLKSTVQLMKCLAQEYDILYVDYTYSWTDIIHSVLGRKHIPVLQILGIRNRISRHQLDLNCTIDILRLPPIIPCNWINNYNTYKLISFINSCFTLFFLKSALRKLKFKNSIIINAFQPWLGYFWTGKLDEKVVIYYCYDEISAAPWINKHGHKMEQEFMKKTDWTIVTSNQLLKSKSTMNQHVSVVKNGVDTSLFSFESCHQSPLQSTKTDFTYTIGYLGSIDERIDIELLSQVISAAREYLFKFVGRITDLNVQNKLSRYKNVEFVGPLPPEKLPTEVDKMDVCLIPFKINKLTASIYPLKINEYLLRGKPVVSTPFADLSDFDSMISIAKKATTFLKCIENYTIEKPSLFDIQRRIDFASSNSWQSRANDFSQIIQKLTT